MAVRDENIIYLDAKSEHIESLKTIVPRSFFEVNPRMKNLLPDTPAMREWWGRVFEDLVSNPNSHVPIAVDKGTNTVVGAFTLDGILRGEPFGGALQRHPATEDHDAEDWTAAIKEFAEHDEQIVGDRNRFLVEILGVDSAYQGKGIGQRLVARACEFADAKGWPIYLETSMAKGFYLRLGLGFEPVSTEDDPAAKSGQLLRKPGAKEGLMRPVD